MTRRAETDGYMEALGGDYMGDGEWDGEKNRKFKTRRMETR